MSSKLLSTTQAAAALGIPRRTVQQLCDTGKIRAEKIGRDWLIKESALNKFTPRKRGRPRKEGQ
jgi:excisionase family DNA binding protein